MGPSLVTKIDVNVRHGNPFGIEESLKKKIVFHGVNGSDTETISYQTSRHRTPSWTHRNVVILGIFDKIHNDKKITGKIHFLDNV